jgi:glycosyltransferase involved in cell wall biosynthesis
LTIRALPRSWWRRLLLFHQLRGASVVLQRHLLPGWQLAFLRRRVAHLLFDCDDAIFLRDSYSSRGLHDPRRLRRFSATLRACDAVIAGNGFLAEQAARWVNQNRVHIIPTCVDPDRYVMPSSAGDGKEMVWIGSSSTLQGLEAIAPLLDRLGQRIPGLRLKVICDRFPTFAQLPVVACPWSESTEAEELASGDIGISWVPDDPWSRGKCGLKVLQYMAAGLPVIANPVGVHREMIREGATGYLASTFDEWVTALERLSDDASLRQRMGCLARSHLQTRYTVAAGARAWIAVLDWLDGPCIRRVG